MGHTKRLVVGEGEHTLGSQIGLDDRYCSSTVCPSQGCGGQVERVADHDCSTDLDRIHVDTA